MTKMVECEIDSVRVSLTNQDRVVVIKDKNSERYLPIWIGLYESESLTIALQGIQTARPLTHDLILRTIQSLGAQFLRVEIIAIEKDVYYAQLVLLLDGKQVNVDCRPSDALILMVRARLPMLVTEEIMATAAIQPEERKPYDLNAVSLEEETGPDPNLSVFSDFLSTLGDDGIQQSPDSPEQPEASPSKEPDLAVPAKKTDGDTDNDLDEKDDQSEDDEDDDEDVEFDDDDLEEDDGDDDDDNDETDISSILFPKINDN